MFDFCKTLVIVTNSTLKKHKCGCGRDIHKSWTGMVAFLQIYQFLRGWTKKNGVLLWKPSLVLKKCLRLCKEVVKNLMKILQRFSEPHLRSEVMTNVIYVLNMALTKIVKQVVHEKNWFGSKALVKHLKIFASMF